MQKKMSLLALVHKTTGFGLLLVAVMLSIFVGSGMCQTCYHCNYFQASSTDPGLQTALGTLTARQPSFTQCGTFPYFSSGSVPTIDCTSLNLTMFGDLLGGLPFTGWMCMKQSYTVTLMNYADGMTVVVPGTVRGCVPVQNNNPFNTAGCNPSTNTLNPYVRAMIASLYFPNQNVGPVATSTGSGTNANQGEFCMCYGNYCNTARQSQQRNTWMSIIGALFLAIFFSHVSV